MVEYGGGCGMVLLIMLRKVGVDVIGMWERKGMMEVVVLAKWRVCPRLALFIARRHDSPTVLFRQPYP